MRGRYGSRIAQTKLVEIAGDGGVAHALGLVDGEQDAAPGFAQVIGDHAILRRQSQAAIDDEDHDIGFNHGLARLLGHLSHDAFLGNGFEAAGIDGDERTVADPAFAVVAIARQARNIRNQRVTRARQTVEEGRFADIRPPYKGNDWFHACVPHANSATANSDCCNCGWHLHG